MIKSAYSYLGSTQSVAFCSRSSSDKRNSCKKMSCKHSEKMVYIFRYGLRILMVVKLKPFGVLLSIDIVVSVRRFITVVNSKIRGQTA